MTSLENFKRKVLTQDADGCKTIAVLVRTLYFFYFLFLFKNIDCRYSLEPSRRGGSNEYPRSMF